MHRWKKFLEVIILCVWVVVGMFISELIIAYPLYWLLGEHLSEPFWNSLYIILADLLRIVIIILLPHFCTKHWQTTREELGLNGLPTWTDVGLGPIAYVAYIFLFSGALELMKNFSWFDATEAQDLGYTTLINPADKIIAFIALAVITPIVEEIIFRGFLYGKIRARLPMLPSILIVSVLFGALHGQWNVAIGVFILSVLNCSLREITGTIYAGILTHMTMNGLAVFVKYVLL
ncbi:CPBP family intramembrane metalloprotease [Candidatus Saccharibacteria bacterium]|nr:CPBP family intramembrane metalloprotease [Candidatus Saccharibacteria bacterium]